MNKRECLKLFGLKKSATIEDIKARYKELALQYHPDKNSSKEAHNIFVSIKSAYECLIKDDGGSQENEDAQRWRTKEEMEAAAPYHTTVLVTLEDAYHQRRIRFNYTRYNKCMDCPEERPVKKKIIMCDSCHGMGCSYCTGTGVRMTFGMGDPECNVCNSTRFVEESIEAEVNVPSDLDKIILEDDVIVHFQEQQHERYKRDGMDLRIEEEIDLFTALSNKEIYHDHISGETIKIKRHTGDIIQPGETRIIRGKGIPFKSGLIDMTGDLYITFHIKFPEPGSISEEQIEKLKIALPGFSVLPRRIESRTKGTSIVDRGKNESKPISITLTRT